MKSKLLSIFFLMISGLLQAQVQIGQDIDGEAIDDWSGMSVAISADGSRIVRGAHLNDGNGINSGQIRAYENQGGQWVQLGGDIDGENAGDLFGFSVSMTSNGQRIAAGAPYNNAQTGHVRVFEWNGSNWVQLGQDINGDTLSESGMVVSLSNDGNVVAFSSVGGLHAEVNVYEWNGSAWIRLGNKIIVPSPADEVSSLSLSSDGRNLAIGSQSSPSCGIVRIFNLSGNLWSLKDELWGDCDDNFGMSVSLSPDAQRIAVGAPKRHVFPDNPDGGMVDAGIVQVYEWTGSDYNPLGNEINGEDQNLLMGSSVSLSSNGNRVVFSGDNFSPVKIYDWTGSQWRKIGRDILSEDLGGFSIVAISSDGSKLAVGAPENDGGGLVNSGHVRIFSLNTLSGKIYNDLNQDCSTDLLDLGLRNRTATISPGEYVVQSDACGYWSLDSLLPGTYTITADTSGPWQITCPVSQSFTIVNPNSLLNAPNFGFISTNPCPIPSISVNMPRMRPGFSNQTAYALACNDISSTAVIPNAYAIIQFDTLITVQTASLPFTDLGNHTYRFDLGDILPGRCVNFSMNCNVSVNAILGSTLCIEANLFPVDSCVYDFIPPSDLPSDFTPCSLPWDFSSLSVNGICFNDSILFTVTNNGSAMQCYSPVRLFIDGAYTSLDSVQLVAGQSVRYIYPSNGKTWRLEADQHPLHPGRSHPNATIERCGHPVSWTPNLVNLFPLDDENPGTDIFCGQVRGSYDPNDKTGYPLGVGNDHLIMPNGTIEYRIRFQNTGTDTAFTVVIRDTLDTDLDIFSVKSGVSSHPYEFRMYGPRVLEWTFENILLPDSNTNEPLSHGFVNFTVNQNRNLPDGAEINNSSAIYFDFNSPVITNTTSHIIGRNIRTLLPSSATSSGSTSKFLMVYPNPFSGQTTVYFPTADIYSFSIYDVQGKLVLHHPSVPGDKLLISSESMPGGLYFYTSTNRTTGQVYNGKLMTKK